ncbi:MAG: thioredoxin domain-containing protein [Anaerolineae bacterium]|nr:thioredoxin domain-containing protein [Anaerolineae bacterium]
MNRIMWKRWVLVLVVALLVVACKSAATPEATAVPTTAPAAPATANPTAASAGQSEPTVVPTVGDPTEPVVVTAPDVEGFCETAPLPELPVRPVDDTDWVKGAAAEDAEITIYEYSDFQCPGCGGMYPVLQAFIENNPNVRLVYRHFPLDFHQYAMITAEAAEAAGAQGKFWEMHNLLFDTAQEWSGLDANGVRAKMSEYASALALDVAKFDKELDDGIYTAKVTSQYEESRDLGLPGTPTFIYNGVLYPSDIGLSYQGLEAFMTIMKNQDTLFYTEAPEQTVSADDQFVATLKTTKGDIVVNLLAESAPTHVNSFIFLAQESWYNGAEFFFVRDNFVAVTGDPTNSTVGYPGYYCQGEEQGVFDREGLLGMLSNGQFFITLGADAAQLTGQFALIGQVTEGLDLLDDITRIVVGDPAAPVADILESIVITKN